MRKGAGGISINIRKAGVDDVPLIVQFIKGIAEFEKLSDEVVANERIITESMFGESPAAHAILAEIDGEPAGFAVYFYNFSTFTGRPGLYLEDIFVSEDKRGMGIGEAMMRHLARLAAAKKCERMEWTVLDWNPARSFYESLGAEEMSDWVLCRISGEELEKLGGE